VSDVKKCTDRRGVATDDRRGGSAHELAITGNVVTVRVTVGNDELHRISSGSVVPPHPRPNERVDRRRHIHPLSTGIEQQDPISAEHEIEERLFEVRARRLAEDEKVRVVLVHSKRRRTGAIGSAGIEGRRETSRFDCRW
jgi:hypothetical protein